MEDTVSADYRDRKRLYYLTTPIIHALSETHAVRYHYDIKSAIKSFSMSIILPISFMETISSKDWQVSFNLHGCYLQTINN